MVDDYLTLTRAEITLQLGLVNCAEPDLVMTRGLPDIGEDARRHRRAAWAGGGVCRSVVLCEQIESWVHRVIRPLLRRPATWWQT